MTACAATAHPAASVGPVGCPGAPTAPPCTLVIFGATGDLSRRLLLPALCRLAGAGLLDARFRVIGVGRSAYSDDAYRAAMSEAVRKTADARAWGWLAPRIAYVAGDLTQAQTYAALARRVEDNVIFYLALPADRFETVVDHLGAAGLMHERAGPWRRVVVEKPFGFDLASARALDRALLRRLAEGQVFRIDHFLGKETVQNVLALRFGNRIFEPLWSREHIDHVQITVAETLGVEGRGEFYDATGALRDMVPNHLFQLLATCAIEEPAGFDAQAVRDEKVRLLRAIRAPSPAQAAADAVRARYEAGEIEGRAVAAYRDAPGVAPQSTTETYVALKLAIDNARWAGVPFYLRTGKALARCCSEIAIAFRPAPHRLFRDRPGAARHANAFVVRVQPEEGASVHFSAKVPGALPCLGGVDMNFRYAEHFRAMPASGYETLIYDCMVGDATLFRRADEIEAAWTAVQPLLDAWAQGRVPLHRYRAGSAGPAAAEALLARDGRAWRELEA